MVSVHEGDVVLLPPLVTVNIFLFCKHVFASPAYYVAEMTSSHPGVHHHTVLTRSWVRSWFYWEFLILPTLRFAETNDFSSTAGSRSRDPTFITHGSTRVLKGRLVWRRYKGDWRSRSTLGVIGATICRRIEHLFSPGRNRAGWKQWHWHCCCIA